MLETKIPYRRLRETLVSARNARAYEAHITVYCNDLRLILSELDDLRRFKVDHMPCPIHERLCCDAHCEAREVCQAMWRKEYGL